MAESQAKFRILFVFSGLNLYKLSSCELILSQSFCEIVTNFPFFLYGTVILILLITFNCSTKTVESIFSKSIWNQKSSSNLFVVSGRIVHIGEFLEVFNIKTGLNLFCSLPIFIPRLHQ